MQFMSFNPLFLKFWKYERVAINFIFYIIVIITLNIEIFRCPPFILVIKYT
jgi:hypothetical protein